MENHKQPEENNFFNKPFQDHKIAPKITEEQENIFDDDLSAGKNSLGQNPEQILYNEPENVEDANQIVSDDNDK